MNSHDLPQDIACCLSNACGKILAANHRFCRLFGFTEGEAVWHYLPDLYRHHTEWTAMATTPREERRQVRLRHRSGRSFNATVCRKPLEFSGKSVYSTLIEKN
jgi:PAS domain S-box-containing protein